MPDLAARLASALGDRYTIQRELGRGGMATVYLARDVKHDRDVAIKVLDPELTAAISGERFHREIQIQAKLRHPHVVTLLDSGDADGLLYYVLTYVEGESLRERLARAPLDPGEALRLWREVVDGIAYAHRHGVAHRDIKPDNVLLTEGHALVADFGVAKFLSAPTDGAGGTLTGVGIAVGTPAYMAPEQIAGTADVDHRADIYALGVLGYEMIARRPPFVATSAQSLFAAHITEPPPRLEQLDPNVSPRLAAIIHRCLEKDPDARWRSADELLAALDSAVTPIPGERGSVSQRVTRSPRSGRQLGIGVAAAALVLGATGYAIAREQSRVRWAREVALPDVRRLTDARVADSAFLVANAARRILPRDAELEQLWRRNMTTVPASAVPAGARIFWTAFRGDTASWIPADAAENDSIRLPVQPPVSAAFVVLKIEKRGARTVLLPLTALRAARVAIALDGAGTDTAMASVPVGPVLLATTAGETRTVEMGAFAIDRFEVTNEQYKRFVDAGGYTQRELWDPFAGDSRPIPWDVGIRRFTDRTGRPGPATWEAGSFPSGQERFPVSGVSWYEAAAYARFAGKELPTIHQWRTAAGFAGSAWILPRSNFESDRARAVGLGGMGPFGTFDMAGNVREWCINAEAHGSRRHILGGAWNDNSWAFSDRSTADPFDRSPTNGMRLVRNIGQDSNTAILTAPAPRGVRDYSRERPVSDAEFRSLAHLYDYDRGPLNARIERSDSGGADWIRQTVSFETAYGERMPAHLLLPKRARPPFQAIVFGPGANGFNGGPSEVLLTSLPFLLHSGRAVMYPVLKNTFERLGSRETFATGAVHNMSGELIGPNTYRDQIVMMMKDVRRSVDYLTSRPDIDSTKLAYLGYSWGARVGPIALAIEPRFRVGLLHLGGLMTAPRRPEADEFNFLPRVKVPTLVMSGRYDDVFPFDRTVEPYFRLLGSPAEQKRHVVYPTQHFLPRDQQIAETLNWLDKYFGAPRRQPR